jgi:hypothetical protein
MFGSPSVRPANTSTRPEFSGTCSIGASLIAPRRVGPWGRRPIRAPGPGCLPRSVARRRRAGHGGWPLENDHRRQSHQPVPDGRRVRRGSRALRAAIHLPVRVREAAGTAFPGGEEGARSRRNQATRWSRRWSARRFAGEATLWLRKATACASPTYNFPRPCRPPTGRHPRCDVWRR